MMVGDELLESDGENDSLPDLAPCEDFNDIEEVDRGDVFFHGGLRCLHGVALPQLFCVREPSRYVVYRGWWRTL